MPGKRLVIAAMVLVAVIIVSEAVYVFSRTDKLTMTEGLVLIGIAVAALLIVTGTLLAVWKGLSRPGKNK